MFKTCIECNQKKSITDFRKRKNSKDGYNHSCQPCQLEKDRNYYSQNSTKEKRQKSYLKSKNTGVIKQQHRNNHLKTMYGITQDDYNGMFDEQKGCCAICGKHQFEISRALSVDHDHNTGQIRGLLCHTCNSAIGKFYDNIDLLENAITYLKQIKENGKGKNKNIVS
jgi:hypothetical protein